MLMLQKSLTQNANMQQGMKPRGWGLPAQDAEPWAASTSFTFDLARHVKHRPETPYSI